MTGMKRSTVAASLACVALMVATATVGAATIKGTAGNDTLRGGAKADRLDGKGGNDKLFGQPGTTSCSAEPATTCSSGGPGADRLTCGAGQDTARGDAQDKIGADCEIVKGVPSAEPPTTAAACRQPPPPPAAPVTPGTYQGSTQNGNFVFFTVTSNRTFTGLRVNDLPEACEWWAQPHRRRDFGDSTFTIRDDGTFDAAGQLGRFQIVRDDVELDALGREDRRSIRHGDLRRAEQSS